MKHVSDVQIERVRHQVQSTLHYLESVHVTSRDIEYQLRSVEISIILVLAGVVELLPTPLYEDVKRLLDMRERLWNERYLPQSEAQEEGREV